ncbi:UrcA family protein [Aerophototrophica crusticola]|uniref:UrcA family protein n=1 Tax=Aerophototrophica crusticola TaxID=1709002 RepID=A0A858RBG7_9PROT|nr:UrcA family protein [Rhodospirillaceae bacterium B3]
MARYALGTLAGALALLVAGMASAADPDLTVRAERDVRTADSFRIHVPYGDLDLASADGVETLRDRVRSAAWQGCSGLYEGDGLLVSLRVRTRCAGDSSRAGLAQVDQVVRLAQDGKDPGTRLAMAFAK